MKIAVCFSGQMRTAIDAAPHLLNFFGELLPDIDFFIHTWDINQYKRYYSIDGHPNYTPPVWRLSTSCKDRPIEKISEENLLKYKEIYNPKKMIVDVYDENKIQFMPQSHTPLWVSAKKSIELCIQHACETSTSYDVIIKMRPDILFKNSTKLINIISIYNLDKSKLYSSYIIHKTHHIDDMVFLGSMTTMLAASIYMDVKLKLGIYFLDFLKNIKIETEAIHMQGLTPCRPETKFIKKRLDLEECTLHHLVDRFWYDDCTSVELGLQIRQELYEDSDLL